MDESLPLARPGDNQTTLARVLYGLADTHFRIGNTSEATESGEESLQIARDIGDTTIELMALNRLGTLKTFTEAGDRDLDGAEKLLEECLKLARRIGDRQRESAALTNLGVVYSMRKDTPESIRYTEMALEILREVYDLRGVIICVGNLGGAYLELKDMDKSA